ncbi:protein BEAN1-like [Hoplias malabaricus]|uniref:protein BEAN1-like n=1 Tax=Hoplias malabaricus TaxID=27720 RepID=UPI00346273EC
MSSEESLLLAGFVIGLVIIISCISIIIGRLSKGNRKRNPYLRTSRFVGDRYFVGSNGELRQIRSEDSRAASDWDSYMETISQSSDTCLDSPPQYDECMEPNSSPIYDTSEAPPPPIYDNSESPPPPPYSLVDPCRHSPPPQFLSLSLHQGSSDAPPYAVTEWDSSGRPVTPVSPREEAPPYETVVRGDH